MEHKVQQAKDATSRRSVLRKGLAVGGAGAIGAGLLANGVPAVAEEESGGLTAGDAAILRFLAAIEIIETDLWQQYNELGGIQDGEVIDGEAVSGGSGSPAYTAALQVLDGDMPEYIHDNSEDEISLFMFINAYLMSKGAATVNLDQFRTLPGSTATGVQPNTKRLTNLMQLTVDTSYWTRYRSRTGNPDLGDTFAQAVPGLFNNGKGQFPAIPRNNGDLAPANHIQAIANTAGFHFWFIEQGGTSLYPQLAARVTPPEGLPLLLCICPPHTTHLPVWPRDTGNT